MNPAYRASDVRLARDPRTGRWAYATPSAQGYRGTPLRGPRSAAGLVQGYRFGAEIAPAAPPPTEAAPPESFSMTELSSAFTHAITPTLIAVGIATGAAFAIGSGLVSKYLFKDRR